MFRVSQCVKNIDVQKSRKLLAPTREADPSCPLGALLLKLLLGGGFSCTK